MLQQVKEFERHLISEEKSKATVDRFTHTNLSTINHSLQIKVIVQKTSQVLY